MHEELGDAIADELELQQSGQSRKGSDEEKLEPVKTVEAGSLRAQHIKIVFRIFQRVDAYAEGAGGYGVVRVLGEDVLRVDDILRILSHLDHVILKVLGALGHENEHALHLGGGEGGREEVSRLAPTVALHIEQITTNQGVQRLVEGPIVIGKVVEALDRDGFDEVGVAQHYRRPHEVVRAHVLGLRAARVYFAHEGVEVLAPKDRPAHVTHDKHRRYVRYVMLPPEGQSFVQASVQPVKAEDHHGQQQVVHCCNGARPFLTR